MLTMKNPDGYASLGAEPIRRDIAEALVAYVEDRCPVGGFLTAVLSNDLKGSISKADDQNLRALYSIVGWLYNEAPGPCWGSPEKVAQWLAPEEKA